MIQKPKRGRPVTTGKTAQRQFGRVNDTEWEILQEAAAASGESFSGWARRHLLRIAKRRNKSVTNLSPSQNKAPEKT